jgi:hypothetical protein
VKYWLLSLALALLLPVATAEAVNKASTHKVSVHSQPMLTNFTFRGNHFGDPAEEVIRRSFKVEEWDKKGLPRYNTPKDVEDCLASITDSGESRCVDGHSDLNQLLEYDKVMIYYDFYNKKFSGFQIIFPLQDFPGIETMLLAKYGKPHKNIQDTVQNMEGANFDQFISIWNTQHGPMKLYYRYPDLESGYLELEDTKVQAQINALKKKTLEEKAKTSF